MTTLKKHVLVHQISLIHLLHKYSLRAKGSYKTCGAQHKMTMQGALFKKQEKGVLFSSVSPSQPVIVFFICYPALWLIGHRRESGDPHTHTLRTLCRTPQMDTRTRPIPPPGPIHPCSCTEAGWVVEGNGGGRAMVVTGWR